MANQRSSKSQRRPPPSERRTQPRTDDAGWRTAITRIEPNEILIRGYAVDELMGRLSFAEAVYLILRGELPTPTMGKLFGAVLVSSIDHGVTPPSTLAARNVATDRRAPARRGRGRRAGLRLLPRGRRRDLHALPRRRAGARPQRRELRRRRRRAAAGLPRRRDGPRRASATGSTPATRARRACSRWRTNSNSTASTCRWCGPSTAGWPPGPTAVRSR